jgi:hypothetical protein
MPQIIEAIRQPIRDGACFMFPLLRLAQDAAQAGYPNMLGSWSSATPALVVGVCHPVLSASWAFVVVRHSLPPRLRGLAIQQS